MDPSASSSAATITISVVVITYQHAAYIDECIQGILAQRTDASVELLIGEDGSTDGTREICQRLEREHPDRVKVFYRTREHPILVLGRPSGRRNLIETLRAARGKYIAFCEGDDHWIEPGKLQMQWEAMELDEAASGCFTNAYNETDGERQPFIGGYTKEHEKDTLNLAEYLAGQGIPTCTFMFRRSELEHYLSVLPRLATGDTALFTSLLGLGHFIYLPVFTGVRVMHPGGVYSMKGALHHVRVQLHNLPAQDALTGYKYRDLIQARMHSTLKYGWNEGLRHKNWELARLVWDYLRKDRSILGWSLYRTLVNGYMVHYPDSFQRLMRWKRRISGGNE